MVMLTKKKWEMYMYKHSCFFQIPDHVLDVQLFMYAHLLNK